MDASPDNPPSESKKETKFIKFNVIKEESRTAKPRLKSKRRARSHEPKASQRMVTKRSRSAGTKKRKKGVSPPSEGRRGRRGRQKRRVSDYEPRSKSLDHKTLKWTKESLYKALDVLVDQIWSRFKMIKMRRPKCKKSGPFRITVTQSIMDLVNILREERMKQENIMKEQLEKEDEDERKVSVKVTEVVDQRAQQAMFWFMRAISSINTVLSSRTEDNDIDDERCNLALLNLGKEIKGWLAEIFGTEDSSQLFPLQSSRYSTAVDLYEEEGMLAKLDAETLVPAPIHIEKPRNLRKETFLVEDEKSQFAVDVNFIFPTGERFNRKYKSFSPIEFIARDIAGLFMVPADQVVIMLHGQKLMRNDTLAKIGIKPGISIVLQLTTVDPLRYHFNTRVLSKPDRIRHKIVSVEVDEEDVQQVKVVVERRCIRKPFVGGYRHKDTGVEYHDGFSQTHPRTPRCKNKTHRDTQTAYERRKGQNTTVEKSTQNYRRDLYLPDFFEDIITPLPYITAEERERMRDVEGKVRTIQRYWRAYVLRKKIKEFSAEYRRRQQVLKKEMKLFGDDRVNRQKYDIVRRLYPKTKTDFELLYITIEQWRRREEQNIKENFSLPAQPAERYELLNKEISLLNVIDQQRIKLKEEKKASKAAALLNKCAKPIEWTDSKGNNFSMVTMDTQRASDLKEMYRSLCREDVTIEERVELLMSIKYALAIYNERPCNEFISLLEREAELLLAGLKSEHIDFLRKRIKKLFLELMKDPQINPEVAKYVSNSYITQQKMKYCPHCQIMHDTSQYFHCFLKSKARTCPTCDWVDIIGRRRVFSDPYRDILRSLQREEARKGCHASLAFMMQPEDIHYLMCHIWYGASVISERTEIYLLRLPRWDIHREWAPWNCFPVTEDEERWHLEQESIHNVYNPDFIQYVKDKHINAKVYFKQHYRLEKLMYKEHTFMKFPHIKCVPPKP